MRAKNWPVVVIAIALMFFALSAFRLRNDLLRLSQIAATIHGLADTPAKARAEQAIATARSARILTTVFQITLILGLTVLAVLQIRSRERTATLLRESEQKYREAAAAASEANNIKDNFLALLSHELRTPLNAMLGWTQMIKNGVAQGPTFDKAIDAIDRNATLQFRLVEELLDLSRIVTGKFSMDRQPMDLAPTVAAAVESLRPSIGGRRLEVTVEDSEPLTMLGDATRIHQMVSNIVGNAIKFTRAADEIRVTLQRDGHRALLVVRDSGPGIAPDLLPHVFETYRQGRTPALKSGGLGLGLAIVRRIVEGHGGGVAAESTPGHGATFRVTLPLMTRTDAIYSSADDTSILQATSALACDDLERKTEVSLRTLGAVIENSPDFIGVCTPTFEPIYINPAGRRLVGIEPTADVRRLPVRDFFMPEDLPLIDREGIPTLLTEGRWTGLVRFRHFRTGAPIFTVWNAFVIRDEAGATIAIATIGPDLGKLQA